ncbi:hypothetical protein HZ326_13929 [Fusarium oxysporum f. sp. albedinis]|nr:hypothetical protein HZ326_13929 [Fusarium oxysporum f. sp. albedinis]
MLTIPESSSTVHSSGLLLGDLAASLSDPNSPLAPKKPVVFEAEYLQYARLPLKLQFALLPNSSFISTSWPTSPLMHRYLHVCSLHESLGPDEVGFSRPSALWSNEG